VKKKLRVGRLEQERPLATGISVLIMGFGGFFVISRGSINHRFTCAVDSL